MSAHSLSSAWGRAAGKAKCDTRFSPNPDDADFKWDASTLNGWIIHSEAMAEGAYRVFRGIADGQARTDVIAFLKFESITCEAQKAVDAVQNSGREHCE